MSPVPCPTCDREPTVTQPIPAYFVCRCEDCLDYDYRGTGYVETTPYGSGKTADVAVADWNDAIAERGDLP